MCNPGIIRACRCAVYVYAMEKPQGNVDTRNGGDAIR